PASDSFWADLEHRLDGVDRERSDGLVVPYVDGARTRDPAPPDHFADRSRAWRLIAVAAALALVVAGVVTLARRSATPVATRPPARGARGLPTCPRDRRPGPRRAAPRAPRDGRAQRGRPAALRRPSSTARPLRHREPRHPTAGRVPWQPHRRRALRGALRPG